jgi:hypothetical protein
MMLLAAGVVLASAQGCAAGTGEAGSAGSAATQSIRLRPGESARVDHAALEIRFEAVTGDSRCAKGDVCIWAGDATVRVSWHREGGAQETCELHTSPDAPDTDCAGGRIRLVALDPHPLSGRAIPQADYVVTLEVTARAPETAV